MRRLLLVAAANAVLCVPSFGQSVDAEQRAEIAEAIQALLTTELEAFRDRDCDGAMRPTRADLVAACPRLVARRPPGARREIRENVIHVLSAEAAYSVTEFRLPIPGVEGGVPQFVTKIWSRESGEWLIVHVHESLGG